MTKDKINRKCAELEGWELEDPCEINHIRRTCWRSPKGKRYKTVPDYTTDMNAASRIIDKAVEVEFGQAMLVELEAVRNRYISPPMTRAQLALHSRYIKERLCAAIKVLDAA